MTRSDELLLLSQDIEAARVHLARMRSDLSTIDAQMHHMLATADEIAELMRRVIEGFH